jgi:hypothetical protein
VKIYPLTTKVPVLCINSRGARGVEPLKYIKRIQDYIRLPMPPQRFFKVVVRTSSDKCYKKALEAYLTLFRRFRRY